jgi:hypothetical protein
MPVTLNASDYDVWLDPGLKDTAGALEMLKPYDPLQMRGYPVSSRVNQVQNDDAGCANPVERESPPQGQLFGWGSFERTNCLLNRPQLCDTRAVITSWRTGNAKRFSYNKRTMEPAMVPFLPLRPYEESITYVLSTR